MASSGRGSGGDSGTNPRRSVTDLLQNLNLTANEEAILEFSDDEDPIEAPTKWNLLGKVLAPSPVHVNTIRAAMKPAWGNPYGMKLHSIGEKASNMFVAEFGSKTDMDRVLAGSRWLVGRYAIIF